ncbi:MAG TPA: ABC transporter permease [Thermomicrobiales bacterium]|jgi:osmoprotectant transport system permease protein|nr:ABC transporter permease [Thermomicrobiales bacterium]
MQYILDNPGRVFELTIEHLQLVFSAILIAALIGIPLGILISRVKWLALPVLNISGVLYTVPSLAFFAILIPYTGIGKTTAITALAVYSLLAIVRNTAAGMNEVPASVVDAARGMGMGQFQRLRLVELPLAIPYIFAGIRLATVAGIGIGAIAAVIGGGGLGRLIFDGIRTIDSNRIVAGALMCIILALLAEYGFSKLALLLRPDMRVKAERG